MKLPRHYVDGFLVEWEAGEYEAQAKSMRQRSEAITPRVAVSRSGNGARKSVKVWSTSERAQAVRDRLKRTARRVPEVMVKITSACRGMTRVGRHIDYISRKGLIDLEDQDGLIVRGKDRLKELKEEWRTGGPEEVAAASGRRDTLNVVFSMPAHTDEVSMKRAVRSFAATEFAGHQYVFAYHTQATDPDPDPPAHPHVHLSVKTQGWSGERLNPRKADLQRWREGFAEQLRAHGIEANATSRLARLKRDPGQSRAAIELRARGARSGEKASGLPRSPRCEKLEADRIAYYGLVTDTLLRSEDPADRQLATDLAQTLKERLGPELVARPSRKDRDQDI